MRLSGHSADALIGSEDRFVSTVSDKLNQSEAEVTLREILFQNTGQIFCLGSHMAGACDHGGGASALSGLI